MAAVHDNNSHEITDLLTSIAPSNWSQLLWSCLLLSILLPFYRIILKDYHAFLALGPGGTPSNFRGYLRVTYLRLFALRDPFQPPSLAYPTCPKWGYLRSLPQRSRPRPVVGGIAPQRQLNQKCGPQLHTVIRAALHKFADGFPSLIHRGNSCFEKNGLALFLSACAQSPPLDTPHPGNTHLNPTCQDTGEICHLHATDSSMHLTLHPLDAALVLASGWGERHPLAGCLIHGNRLLPSGFVMVYAPCEESEVSTVMEIVKAAGWWVGGVDLGGSKVHDASRAPLPTQHLDAGIMT